MALNAALKKLRDLLSEQVSLTPDTRADGQLAVDTILAVARLYEALNRVAVAEGHE